METYHSNMARRWVLSLHHPILFPVTTIIIMELFINKMRRLKGIRKMIVIEEAWKAIASANMASYIKYLYKTVRKFFGEAVVVTQEVEDIISSAIVKDSIINNSEDVYKRQVVVTPQLPHSYPTATPQLKKVISVIGTATLSAKEIMAVSYTHLF